MKCLMRFEWVKLFRSHLPQGKGIMGYWAKLASRAAFRKGHAVYCGYRNEVIPGMWSGGVVGLKSILGIKNRRITLETMDKLSELGYITYDLNPETKKLTYQITDWVMKCCGEECLSGAVYTTDGYGFLCLPRNITERLVECNYIFEEADAWLDLWCHTTSRDRNNAFSYFAPVIQYGKYKSALTLEYLGSRWGWEKTKVWRFFKKHSDIFTLYRLPSSYGCLIFNTLYPTNDEIILPTQEQIIRILDEMRAFAANTHKSESDNEKINRIIAWYSRRIADKYYAEESAEVRVVVSSPIIRAYISPCDCRNNILSESILEINNKNIRGPCKVLDLEEIIKEFKSYEQ